MMMRVKLVQRMTMDGAMLRTVSSRTMEMVALKPPSGMSAPGPASTSVAVEKSGDDSGR